MAHVVFRYFAALREAKGVEREIVEISPGEPVADVVARLFPGGAGPWTAVRSGRPLAPADAPADGDEVFLLPPVGGG